MSLNITVLSEDLIYQSGDFRLVDWHGQRVNFEAQKQIQITRFRWSAVVAFVGIGSVRNLLVSEWLAGKTAELPQDANFGALIDVLLSADEWIQRLPLQRRLHTFSVGAFVGHRPLFAIVSNFEAVHARPSRLPRPRLQVSYLRPRRERVFVTGRPATVLKLERQSLIGLLRAKATPEVVMNALARVNAAAHARDEDYISDHCFTSFVRLTGEGGGMVHGLGELPYVPKFMVPVEMEDAVAKLLRDQFPQGAQLRSFSTMRAPSTEADHLVQVREKPNDPNVHNNYGTYLRDVAKDDSRAEQAYLRALELDPDHSNALGNLANVLWDRGELDRAEELYQQAVAADTKNVTHRVNLGKFLLNARNDAEAALKVCEEGRPDESDNPPLLELHCLLLARKGEYDRAAEQYDRLYKLRPDSPEIALRYGAVLHAAGAALETAEPLYRQVLAQEPTNGQAMLNLAQIRFQLGAEEEAGALVRAALKAELTEGEKVEALFCWYAFEGNRGTLRELRTLLVRGARSRGWDLTPVVARAVAVGHEDVDFLRVLGAVVVDAKPLRELGDLPLWRGLET